MKPYCFGSYPSGRSVCERCGFKGECFRRAMRGVTYAEFWRRAEEEGVFDDERRVPY